MFSPYNPVKIAEKAGWHISKEIVLDSSYLQDGSWEVDYVQKHYPGIIQSIENVQKKMKDLLYSQLKLSWIIPTKGMHIH